MSWRVTIPDTERSDGHLDILVDAIERHLRATAELSGAVLDIAAKRHLRIVFTEVLDELDSKSSPHGNTHTFSCYGVVLVFQLTIQPNGRQARLVGVKRP